MSAKNTSLHCDSVGGGSHNGSLRPAASSRAQSMGGWWAACPAFLPQPGQSGSLSPGSLGTLPSRLGRFRLMSHVRQGLSQCPLCSRLVSAPGAERSQPSGKHSEELSVQGGLPS